MLLALVFVKKKIHLNYIGLSSVNKFCDLVSAEPYNLEKDLNRQHCLLVQISSVYVFCDSFQCFHEDAHLHLVSETNVENLKVWYKWGVEINMCPLTVQGNFLVFFLV